MYFGICVTILVTISWVGATHAIKFLYLNTYEALPMIFSGGALYQPQQHQPLLTGLHFDRNGTTTFVHARDEGPPNLAPDEDSSELVMAASAQQFSAPFFVAWFTTNFLLLFFPLYLLGRVAMRKCDGPSEILGDVLRGFRDRGFTVGMYINRCMVFCVLWLLTTYLYILSLKALLATDVLALFSTNVACVYLLSWVILHEQFVGIRIVAVIMCDTGIALLAYMDGITGTPTLSGVVLAALAAAGYAVFKVMFRKMMGERPPIGQIAFTFTFLGFLNGTMIWPICISLYLSGIEVMPWDLISWIVLLIASILILGM